MSKFAYGEVRYIIKGKNKIVSSKKERYRFGSRLGRQKRASVSIGALTMAVIFLLSACGARDSGIYHGGVARVRVGYENGFYRNIRYRGAF